MNTYVSGREKMFLLYSDMPISNGHLLTTKYFTVEKHGGDFLKQVIKFNILCDGTGWHQTPPNMRH